MNEHTKQKHALMRSMVDIEGLGLEIGPGRQGVVPKRDGFNVKIADYASADHLKTLGATDADLIEEVDFVTDGGSVRSAIPEGMLFDYIIASHVIEHIPDFIQFMQDCESLLKPEGVLLLAVPDKRYIFDAMRPHSTLGEIWQAHAERRTRHPAARHFDFYAYGVSRGGGVIWAPQHDSELKILHSLSQASQIFDSVSASPDYADIHGWVFVPASFRLIMRDLAELGVITIRENQWSSDGPEFYISLSRQSAENADSRPQLIEKTLAELSQIKNVWAPV